MPDKNSTEEETKTRKTEGAIPEEQTVTELFDDIIKDAYDKQSSDVHFEPRENDMIVRYRIDGILHDILTIAKELEPALIFKIKIVSNLKTDEHFAPQDGRIRFIFEEIKFDSRVSIIPTTHGEKVVIRLLTSGGKALELKDLGFDEPMMAILERSYTKPYGMIISSGPTGSGKTTTLYSMLKLVNSRERNILTIEDPVEYSIDGVNHIQVNSKAKLTFATGLRALLRQDPNIIMIGEIRDKETAQIAINAAMTGHLVLSTIHTNDSITTVPRLIDMGVERYLVATTVNVIVAQRLARRLCPKCKKQAAISQEQFEHLLKVRKDLADMLKVGTPVFEEAGCTACRDTGFKGRVGLFEVLEIDKDLRVKISEGANADELFDIARKKGLLLIVEDGVKKILAGDTSVSEILRVTAIRE
ncbi:MAG: GspE/PulE family protein [Candidatus Dojkabacteria bacterium]|nr:GspE/PulE family protein [Candidatus Dojkabacteria bacterium]